MTMRLCILLGVALLSCTRADILVTENDIPELAYLDTSIDPCDDFYQFACGNFKNVHPRPSDANIVDHFTLLEKELVKIGNEILSSPKLEDDPVALKKAKSAYKGCISDSCMSNSYVPELRTVAEFGGMPLISSNATTTFGWSEIGDLVGKYGVHLIFVYSIAQLEQNETVIVVNTDTIVNPGLLRPNHHKTYEDALEEDFVKKSAQPFDVFLQTLAKNLLKYTNPNKPDDEILADLNEVRQFSIKLVKGVLNQSVHIAPLKTPLTLDELQEWTNAQFGEAVDMDWIDYFSKIFQYADFKVDGSFKLHHHGIEKIYRIMDLVRQTESRIVKNFALLRVFLFQAPDSNAATRTAFENYYKAKGLKVYPRWEYCTRKIIDIVDTASLSYAVTYSYEKTRYNTSKISQASQMVSNIRDAFEEILSSSDWLDDTSRVAALKKVKNMLVLLAHPDFVANQTQLDQFYENLRICEWDNYGNARNIRAFKQAYQYSQLGISGRNFWGKSTFNPNAYYNRPNNKIVIPIAMLNPVFFNGSNPILDYSRLGSIIGHEITHGFDENGKNYDENGKTASWWSDQTMDSFTKRSKCFKEQYSQYYVAEIGHYVNGSSTINENLADNGGLRESYKAFKQMMANSNIRVSGNYTADRLFFIGYATMWCSNESTRTLSILTSDTSSYPPNRFRVIGVLSNMAEFSDTFSCPRGSKMNPESKCLLW